MDTYMVILRLIHIIAGVFWVGALLELVGFVLPAARAAGQQGQPFLQAFISRTRFSDVMAGSAALTVVAGVLLYYRVSGHFNSDWVTSTPGVVLSLGAVAGIAAAVVGVAIMRPTTKRMGTLMVQLSAQQGPPSETQMAEMRRLQIRNEQFAPVVALLSIIAVVGMAAARYM